jgi:cellulose synthase/poly-beta-1,6-N-acetylglucosamine synthase-like glycosyltransferase
MTVLGVALFGLPIVLAVYAYAGYPLLLLLLGGARRPRQEFEDPEEWPTLSLCLPAYNEEASITATLESLLALDYPPERRQILVVSDASSDRTDELVQGFAPRGIELLRQPTRRGKTAAENAAAPRLRGEIVVNCDATIRIPPQSLKPLIRVFQDPAIGLASGRDISVGDIRSEHSRGESGYVGYEMWLRSLETRLGSIVGASGCFYAIRRPLVADQFPDGLSRDFASALITREHGLRAVSVDEAVCLVPRSQGLRPEYRRKVRTMTRGLQTLWYQRSLLNPFRYGAFAWMLLSHKLLRWLVFPSLPLGAVGLSLLALGWPWARIGLLGAGILLGLGLLAFRWPGGRPPLPIAVSGFAFMVSVAGLAAWLKALQGEQNRTWEPTRRSSPPPPAPPLHPAGPSS